MKKQAKAFLWGGVFVGLLVLMLICFDKGKKAGLAELERRTAKIDSLEFAIREILSRPPDTVRVVTIRTDTVTKWRTRYIETESEPQQQGPRLRADSLVNNELAIYVLDSIEGRLLWRNLGYRLFVPKTITETVTVTEQVPVFVEKEVPAYYSGIWLSGDIGGGSEFAYSLGLEYSWKRNSVGVSYLNFGGTNNWMVGYSYLIYRRK
jgi:hypothetical protein